jgi:hypothetical protein
MEIAAKMGVSMERYRRLSQLAHANATVSLDSQDAHASCDGTSHTATCLREVDDAIQALPSRERSVILSLRDGYALAEIARRFEVTPGGLEPNGSSTNPAKRALPRAKVADCSVTRRCPGTGSPDPSRLVPAQGHPVPAAVDSLISNLHGRRNSFHSPRPPATRKIVPETADPAAQHASISGLCSSPQVDASVLLQVPDRFFSGSWITRRS